MLTAIRFDGQTLLTTPPVLSLWRAPTDNDGLKLAPNQELKPLGRWRSWGLEHVTRGVDRVRSKQTSDGRVMTVRAHFAAADDDIEILQNTTYLCDANGVVTITEDIRVPKELDDLPRLGFAFELPPTLEQLCGSAAVRTSRIPTASSRVRSLQSTITDQYVPYVMQEHGGLTPWLAPTASSVGAICLSCCACAPRA